LIALPEGAARWISHLLLGGWLGLVVTLLLPAFPGHSHGTQLFWGTTLPLILALLALVGTAPWRRICPLAHLSQLPRALGRHRGGSTLVPPSSWLGRHHLRLQWGLLVSGLTLRLLWVNHDPWGLGLLFAATILAALLSGWLWDGKTWCHLLCPMGPVEAILMGLRPVLRPRGRLPESLCRTLDGEGRERSTCVHCHSPCLDIDASKAYRTSLREERGLGAAWWSYPGLVLAFFLLLDRSGATTPPWPMAVLGLSVGCAGSLLLFWLLHRAGVSLHRTRLLATTSAIWIVFWFSDPTLGLWGGWPYHLLQLLVAVVSLRWLLWGWSREVSN
jgi:hypothetical protein